MLRTPCHTKEYCHAERSEASRRAPSEALATLRVTRGRLSCRGGADVPRNCVVLKNLVMLSVAKHLDAHPARPFATLRVTRGSRRQRGRGDRWVWVAGVQLIVSFTDLEKSYEAQTSMCGD